MIHPEAQQYEEAAPALLAAAKLQPPRIVDVIVVESHGNKHYYVVVDRSLRFIYSRNGQRITGRDGAFYDFLSGSGAKGEAFGGRVFDLEMDDGTKFRCQGDVWHVGWSPEIDTISVGASSQEHLNECYVFSSASVERSALEEWLANNQPKTEYYALDPREPARKAYEAQRKADAAARLARQAACTHDYEEQETEVCWGEDSYPAVMQVCKLCGHETDAVEIVHVEEDDHL